MNLLYKECEVCGTKINKLQSWWNIYALRAGSTLKCSKCNTEYKTSKIIGFIGEYYSFFGPLICVILIVSFIDSFKLNLGIEVWLYAILIYTFLELIIMGILPLYKIENKK